MSSSQNNEGRIRAAMVDANVVEVIIALPGEQFFNTQIPACLWFLAKDKRVRQGEVLLFDARKPAVMISRVQCELTDIAEHGHVLTPGRYVGAEAVEDNDDFATKMQRQPDFAQGVDRPPYRRARTPGRGSCGPWRNGWV